MKKAFSFLQNCREVSFATSIDNIPKLRVFQIMHIDDENIYFATAPHKDVYSQLQSNPFVEILALQNGISVRMAGKAIFDVEDSMCQHIYDTNEVLPRLYKSYTDLKYFRLTPSKIDYYDLNTNPPTFESKE